jgi:hypothetical protein
MKGTRNKTNTNPLINTFTTSQNRTIKPADNSYTSINQDKTKKALNERLNLLNEYKRTNASLSSKKNQIVAQMNKIESQKSLFINNNNRARQNLRTKLIPRERFINSSLTSTDFRGVVSQTTGGGLSTENNLHNLNNFKDLEQLDYKNFENTIKREQANDKLYNTDLLNMLNNKHKNMTQGSNRFHLKMNNFSVTEVQGDNSRADYISYSRNVSNPKQMGSVSFTDKLNTSNITVESEKSFNNNIVYTDGGITNINIHGILTCEEVPNEIYFNDKRYKAIQETLNNILQDNLKNSKTIKELKSTIEILKCYINIQDVKFI